MSFMINFEGAGSYSGPFEGAGSALLPFQGYTYGRIVKVTEGEAKESKNKTLKLEVVVEEDEAKGMRLLKTQPVTGMRSDKKPNVQGLLDILYSVYSGIEPNREAAMARVKALEGNQIDAEGIIAELTGKNVWLDVNDRKFTREDGSDGWASDIRNFVGKERYTDAKATNIHHRQSSAGAIAFQQGGASASSNGAVSGAAAKPAGSGGATAKAVL